MFSAIILYFVLKEVTKHVLLSSGVYKTSARMMDR